jgi:hypothetical protein
MRWQDVQEKIKDNGGPGNENTEKHQYTICGRFWADC